MDGPSHIFAATSVPSSDSPTLFLEETSIGYSNAITTPCNFNATADPFEATPFVLFDSPTFIFDALVFDRTTVGNVTAAASIESFNESTDNIFDTTTKDNAVFTLPSIVPAMPNTSALNATKDNFSSIYNHHH